MLSSRLFFVPRIYLCYWVKFDDGLIILVLVLVLVLFVDLTKISWSALYFGGDVRCRFNFKNLMLRVVTGL